MMLIWPAHVVSAAVKASTSGGEPLGNCGMDSEQKDPGLCHWASALNRNLPEVFVERDHDASFGLREIQQVDIACSSEIRAYPQNVVTAGSKCLYDRLRKVLIGEEAHLRWNRERLVFVGEIAGV